MLVTLRGQRVKVREEKIKNISILNGQGKKNFGHLGGLSFGCSSRGQDWGSVILSPTPDINPHPSLLPYTFSPVPELAINVLLSSNERTKKKLKCLGPVIETTFSRCLTKLCSKLS